MTTIGESPGRTRRTSELVRARRMTLTQHIETCHRCARAAGTRGTCPADGVTLPTHAEAGYCPLALYGDGARPARFPETSAEELAKLRGRIEARRKSAAMAAAREPPQSPRCCASTHQHSQPASAQPRCRLCTRHDPSAAGSALPRRS